jgi:hypothetical protein
VVSLIEGRDIGMSLVPGRGSPLEHPRLGRELKTASRDLIAAARLSHPDLTTAL